MPSMRTDDSLALRLHITSSGTVACRITKAEIAEYMQLTPFDSETSPPHATDGDKNSDRCRHPTARSAVHDV